MRVLLPGVGAMAVVGLLRAQAVPLGLILVGTLLAAFGYRLVRGRSNTATTPTRATTAITTRTWEAFQQGVAGEVARLEAGATVVISAAAEPHTYVQLAHVADQLYVEAVSNAFLRGDLRLSAEQEQRLAAAGWQPPSTRSLNWWFDRPWPMPMADSQQVGALIVIALRDGLGIGDPLALEYHAWNDDTRERVDLPGLHPAAQ